MTENAAKPEPVYPRTVANTPRSSQDLDAPPPGTHGDDEAGPETLSSDPPQNSQMATADSSHSAPLGAIASNAATSDQDPLEVLRIQLIGLKLVTPQQWQAAIDRCEGAADVHRVLQELKTIPSDRDPRGGSTIPALTDFQVEQILAGNTARLRLQHYVVIERLGAGGMGEVFKAWNLNLERLEAIKTIIQVDVGTGTSNSTQGLARFEREARVLAQLDHPCITTIYHAGREHGMAFIAMEYVSGDNMKDIVDSAFAESDPVPVWWAVERAIAIASALEHAHSKNVIHRDVKPSNVMITEKGDLKVLDMGIARLARPQDATGGTSRLTQNQTGLGTPEVMPPEQWADAAAVTPASDIYSLGCTLFYMLTGRMPFTSTSIQGFMFAHVNDSPPKPSSLRKEIPSGLDKIVVRMLAKEPESRFTNCTDLIAALQSYTSEATAGSDGSSKGTAGKVALAGAAGCVLVAAIAGALWMWKADDSEQPATPEQPAVVASVDGGEVVVTPTTTTEPKNEDSADFDKWLTEFQRQNAEIWESLDELKKFALTGQETVLSPAVRDQLSAKIKAETGRRWKERVEAKLAEYQKAHADVWKDVSKLIDFAGLEKPLEDIRSSKELELLLRKVDRDTWKRRLDNWIADFQMTRSEFWRQREELRDFVLREFPSGAEDETSFSKIENLVRGETQKLINKQMDKWLVDLQKENPTVWTDLEELRGQAAKRVDPSSVTDDASFGLFKNILKSLTQNLKNPFDGIDTEGIRDQAERYRIKSLIESYRWLLSLPEDKKDPAWEFELRFLVDDKEIPENQLRFPPEKQILVQIKPKKDGYVTTFIRSSSGSHLLARSWKAFDRQKEEQYKAADDWQLVTWPITDTPGVDHFSVFYTDVNPFEVVSEPLPLSMEREETDKNGNFMLTRFAIGRDAEEGKLDEFKTLFKDPYVFERVERNLVEAKRYDSLEPTKKVGHWNVKTFTIEVIQP